ncbi:hypothetical protein GCM10018965_029370 [Nonomuraea roseola]
MVRTFGCMTDRDDMRAGASESGRSGFGKPGMTGRMRIGVGLPAAVPGTDMTTLGQWAADSERAGFGAVGVIDRLVTTISNR